MNKADPIETLRARVATLDSKQREKLRVRLEERGISWERLAPSQAPAPRPDRLPLSPSQLHFWIQQQLYPSSSAYRIAFIWRIRGQLDADALLFSLQHLIDRHEPLRTSFPSENGEPWQSVLDNCRFSMAFTDLRGTPQHFPRYARIAANEPFDLAFSPLLRAHLFHLEEEEHALVLSIHHIVADGWSRGVFMRELAACYRAYSEGAEPALTPLPRKFADLALEQNAWMHGAEYQSQKAHWQKHLADLEPQELPTDRPRSGTASLNCATYLCALPAPLSAAVSDLARRLGATTFMVLLAAFKLLLHRYSGQVDLAACVPVAGRKDADAAGLIGLFTNTLVLRTELDPGLTFRGWLDRVRETLADALQHQEFPFAHIVDAFGVNRDGGQNPLFQTMFQVQTEGYRQQNAETVDLGTSALEVTQELMPLSEAKFDLNWLIMEREQGLSLGIEYRTALFDPERIERMAGHFEHLLAAIVQTPDAVLPALDYMPEQERSDLVAFGTPAPRVLPEIGVHEAITAVAAQNPDMTALECAGQVWSYAELEQAADTLACHLLSQPGLAEPGARVAVSLPGNAQSVIALLAILKAGAIYVPLDPKHPEDRLAYILEDAEVTVLLTDDAARFGDVPCMNPAALPPTAPPVDYPGANPFRIAYLLYTSGSTGRPKGAPIEHAGLLNQLRSFAREPGIAGGDRMLAVTTPAFDISILEMLLPLSVGATVVMVDQEFLFAPDQLAKLLEDERLTHVQATPASWRMLLDSGWEGRPGLKALCGGEAMDAQLARRLLERIETLWNVYGPTETTIWASALEVRPEHVKSGKVPIGGPVDNTHLHVLDAYLQPVSQGVPGELFIGGDSLSPGYWKRPSLTAEKFVPNPCLDAGNPTPRLYRTGDLVIRRSNGEMEFVGRTDFQIKLRGYRIEIGEIESLLHEDSIVAQALVVLDKENERLVAYCTLEPQAQLTDKASTARELRRSLAARLPRYMVPGAFVLLDEFPLNTNGKVDRKRLPAPEALPPVTTPAGPCSEAEETLLAIWRDVLQREDIGIEDNFFDLGGDSIVGMQIVARAQAKGLVLAPAQLFEHQTVAAQALVAEDASAPARMPLSLWQHHHQKAEALPWLVSLPVPAVPVSVLQQALTVVADHHTVLGLRLEAGWERDEATVKLNISPVADDGALQTWARSVTTPPLVGRSWRARLTGPSVQPRLALAAHPLLLDSASLVWLASDLRETIDRLVEGAAPALAASGDYGQWLSLGEPETRIPAVPFAGNGTAGRPDEAGVMPLVTTALDPAGTQDLLSTARLQETSAELMVLTALAQVLAQRGGKDLVELDLLTCSRAGLGTVQQRVLGNFTQLLPLSVRLPQGSASGKLAAIANALTSFQGQGRDPSAGAAAETILCWNETTGAGLQWLSVPESKYPSGYPLAVQARLTDNRLSLDWQFDPQHFMPAAIEDLAARHLTELTAMRADGTTSTAKLDRLMSRLKQREA